MNRVVHVELSYHVFEDNWTYPLPHPARKDYTPPVDTSNEPEKEKGKKADDILWHPAFCNAMRVVRGCTVEKKWPGIYIVSGDPLPIQIIDNRELPAEENHWLKGLCNTLDANGWRNMLAEISQLGKSGQVWAYRGVP